MMKLQPGTPDEAGVSPSTIELISKRGQQWIDDGTHSALVLLAARKGVIFLHQAFGRRSPADSPSSLPLDTIFPLASISKVFTATAAMALVEDGLLGLNRPVQEYIPEFQGDQKEKVIVQQLLTHTAGIDDEAVFRAIEDKEDQQIELPAREETIHPEIHRWLHIGVEVPLALEPGSEMMYSSFGIHLIGEIIRRISGQSLDEFARDRIFNPLGMKDTFYSPPEDVRQRIVLHAEDGPYAEENDPAQQKRPSPSGGVFATATDTAVFGQMFLNKGIYNGKRVLSTSGVNAMTRNQIPGIRARLLIKVFPEASWGFGWSVNHAYKGRVYGEALSSPSTFLHSGSGGVLVWIDPELDIVGAYFSTELRYSDDGLHIWNADLFMNMVQASVDEI
jgi:CubicO group peptidase (beta-lactamase class C family)